ncbi:phosphotransferase family protein [Deinococcus koreensis]|uniref:Aminoglycoside phosphotransferase n=1 Tax=Deinococcus koreensis TaxID=2054903 RepID=A0A2K3V120_9DEIO|nr:phosphotransferase [Deinococcus koreensis]PNY82477.1 aminoglycoside phosphotransferase [Deinococcus koreensis]
MGAALPRPVALLGDVWDALRGHGPVLAAWIWPRDLRALFPGPRRVVEAWTGEGAAFARYASAHGPLFLKYLPAGWADGRAAQRLARESAYLRDLAPLSPVRHAPHLHSAGGPGGTRAHLLTRDLTDETTGWGAFQTDGAREAALLEVVRLLARHHAFWSGPGLPHLRGDWAWNPSGTLERAGRMAAQTWRYGPAEGAVQDIVQALPKLLSHSRVVTLAHGDIHSGQVLWPRSGEEAVLIDYGQTHPSVLGEDLAHLLAIRLNAAERARLGPALREAYREELAEHGLALTPSALADEERAGLALNVLSTIRQAHRQPGSGVIQAQEDVLQAWAEAEVSRPRNVR